MFLFIQDTLSAIERCPLFSMSAIDRFDCRPEIISIFRNLCLSSCMTTSRTLISNCLAACQSIARMLGICTALVFMLRAIFRLLESLFLRMKTSLYVFSFGTSTFYYLHIFLVSVAIFVILFRG